MGMKILTPRTKVLTLKTKMMKRNLRPGRARREAKGQRSPTVGSSHPSVSFHRGLLADLWINDRHHILLGACGRRTGRAHATLFSWFSGPLRAIVGKVAQT